MLVNLGAQMSLRKKGQTAVPHKLMASIVIGRLILMPIVCGCVIFGAVAVGVLPTDRILLLLLLLQGATPTAMSLGTISQMHGQYMDEISEIMFVCVSPPPTENFSLPACLACDRFGRIQACWCAVQGQRDLRAVLHASRRLLPRAAGPRGGLP